MESHPLRDDIDNDSDNDNDNDMINESSLYFIGREHEIDPKVLVRIPKSTLAMVPALQPSALGGLTKHQILR